MADATTITPQFLSDLRAAWEATSSTNTAAQLFAALRADLLAAHDAELGARTEHDAVDALAARWAHIEGVLDRESKAFDALVVELGPRWVADPIHFDIDVDLLSVMGRPRSEVLYTQALCALCKGNPKLLRALVSAVAPGWTIDVPDDTWGGATIVAEHVAVIRRTTIIPDAVVWLGADIIVIENKVGVRDRGRQLDDYAAWARNEAGARSPLLLYLTPEGDAPSFAADKDAWICVSYRTVAEVWRRELDAMTGPWADVLRLFLASVLHHVLGFPTVVRGRDDKARLLKYAEAALGRGTTT